MAAITPSLEALPRKRLRWAGAVLLLAYLALIGRLAYVQGAEGKKLSQEAQKARQRSITLRPHRGGIYDRHALPLASSLYSGTLGFDPSVVHPQDAKNKAQLERSLALVAQIVHTPVETLRNGIVEAQQKTIKNPKLRFYPIQRGISLKAAQQIRDTRPILLGFGVEDDDKRIYPAGENVVHVVGYLDLENKAEAGLERSCQKWLTGKPGIAQAEVDVQQRLLPDTVQKMVAAQDGLDVHTTLDLDAQQFAMEEAR
ncbi:MAG TPA: hypothetical protein VKU00_26195, partial [Chthonomonadaceae bacterium]|nr:hypothetical protein [Chthonomonadaceae bacterium]